MDHPSDDEFPSVTNRLRSLLTPEEIQQGTARVAGCYQVAARALFFVLHRGSLGSLKVTSNVSMLPRGNELKPAVRLDCFLEARVPERECVCGGYIPALGTGESFNTYRQQNPYSRPIVVNPDCAECVRFSVAHLAIHYAAASSIEVLWPSFPFVWDSQSKVDQWFEEFSVLGPIKTDLLNRAKALSVQTVRRERKAIKELAIQLAAAEQPLDGRQAERVIRNNLVSAELLV
jgi:hypothetical protein